MALGSFFRKRCLFRKIPSVLAAKDEFHKKLEQSRSLQQVIALTRAFISRILKSSGSVFLPDLSRQLQDPHDLFIWWLEFDKMAYESQGPEHERELLTMYRDTFGAAWDRALALGYKMSSPVQLGDHANCQQRKLDNLTRGKHASS